MKKIKTILKSINEDEDFIINIPLMEGVNKNIGKSR